jgi:D-glycero-D-manno-heptose 1,7-bisphosphate phosphatase
LRLLEKVVFLDRDGVINFDSPDYIKSCAEFEFIPGSLEAIRRLTANGFTSIVVTNQSALARKLISAAELNRIHAMMKRAVVSATGRITDVFYCPHLPGDGCDCRKPAPGLIYQARRKYDIDLAAAVMVGDSLDDLRLVLNYRQLPPERQQARILAVLIDHYQDPDHWLELGADAVLDNVNQLPDWLETRSK